MTMVVRYEPELGIKASTPMIVRRQGAAGPPPTAWPFGSSPLHSC